MILDLVYIFVWNDNLRSNGSQDLKRLFELDQD